MGAVLGVGGGAAGVAGGDGQAAPGGGDRGNHGDAPEIRWYCSRCPFWAYMRGRNVEQHMKAHHEEDRKAAEALQKRQEAKAKANRAAGGSRNKHR